jgi:hypothetical protein
LAIVVVVVGGSVVVVVGGSVVVVGAAVVVVGAAVVVVAALVVLATVVDVGDVAVTLMDPAATVVLENFTESTGEATTERSLWAQRGHRRLCMPPPTHSASLQNSADTYQPDRFYRSNWIGRHCM